MKRSVISTLVAASVVVAGGLAFAQTQVKAPEGAKLYIISPKDGAELTSPVLVQFGLKGMGVAPAGVDTPKTGHHHLLIDGELADPKIPIPNDKTHLHFGGGQTETSVELTPGKHTLQLVLGDKSHVPFDPPIVSDKVTVTVK